MIGGSLFLIVMFAFAVWGIVRDVRREVQIGSDAVAPACCAFCKYEATQEGVARGRCPECGALYMLAGVEGSHQRVMEKLSSKSLYAWVVLLALALSVAATIMVGSYFDGIVSGTSGGVAATVCFMLCIVLLGAAPCWLMHRRRKRVISDLSRRMMPPEQLDQSIITSD